MGDAPLVDRYIVCGPVHETARWRRERGIPVRDVIAVSTTQGHRALRGLATRGVRYTLVVHESWSQAPASVRLAVLSDLEVLRLMGAEFTPTLPPEAGDEAATQKIAKEDGPDDAA